MIAGPHIKMATLPNLNAASTGVIELKTPSNMNKMMGMVGDLEGRNLCNCWQLLCARSTAIFMHSDHPNPMR